MEIERKTKETETEMEKERNRASACVGKLFGNYSMPITVSVWFTNEV